MEEKLIWRQKMAGQATVLANWAQKVGGVCLSCLIGSAANGQKSHMHELQYVRFQQLDCNV